MLVSLLDADAIVNHSDLELVILFSCVQVLDYDLDGSVSACEFDCVRQEVKQDLLNSALVSSDQVLRIEVPLVEPVVDICQSDAFHLDLTV